MITNENVTRPQGAAGTSHKDRVPPKEARQDSDSKDEEQRSPPLLKHEDDLEQMSHKGRIEDVRLEDTPCSPSRANVWRISVIYQQKAERMCWYGEEPTLQAIEDTLRQTFSLPPHTTLSLRNSEGDIVALSSKLPAQEQFVLEAVDNKQHEGYSSDYCSRSDSSGPSSPESCLSDGPSSPHHTPPLVFADTKSRFDRQFARAEGHEEFSNKREADDDLANKKKRKRRKANEIDRAYKCVLGTCRKVYGSENALKMHIKLKHPDQQNIHPPYHAAVHSQYNVFMQSPNNNVYNGYPVAQRPMHTVHTSPVRPSSAGFSPLHHQYPTPTPAPAPTPSMMPSFYHRERTLQKSLSASALPVRPSFADSFNPPALIREPTSSKHLPSMRSLPTLQPSHLPSLPYSRSAPAVSLFGPNGREEVFKARALAW